MTGVIYILALEYLAPSLVYGKDLEGMTLLEKSMGFEGFKVSIFIYTHMSCTHTHSNTCAYVVSYNVKISTHTYIHRDKCTIRDLFSQHNIKVQYTTLTSAGLQMSPLKVKFQFVFHIECEAGWAASFQWSLSFASTW